MSKFDGPLLQSSRFLAWLWTIGVVSAVTLLLCGTFFALLPLADTNASPWLRMVEALRNLPETIGIVLGLAPDLEVTTLDKFGLPIGSATAQLALRFAIIVCLAPSIGIATYRLVLRHQPRRLNAKFVSGATYAEKGAVAKEARKLLADDMRVAGAGIALSPKVVLPRNREIQSILLVGRPRYGKSTAMQFMLDGILARPRDKLIVYDSKGDVVANWPSANVLFLAPHDTRSWGWAVGRDVLGETGARELASALIKVSDREPSWTLGGQEILIAAIRSQQAEHGTAWSWQHLDEVLDLPDKALRQTAFDYHRPALRYLTIDPDTDEFDRTAASYVSTAMAALNQLIRPLAQAWSRLDPLYQISLRDWLLDDAPPRRTIILQGASHLPSISAAWITAALEMMARFCVGPALADSIERRLWYILDEFSTVPKIDALSALLAQGPSKGVCVLLACQNLELVEDKYGNILTKSIIQNMDVQILFRLNAGPTSEYMINTGILKTEFRRHGLPAQQAEGEDQRNRPEIACLITAHDLATLPRGEAFTTIEGSIFRVRWPKSTWIEQRPGMIQALWVTAQVTSTP